MERRTILVYRVSSYFFQLVNPPGGAADSWGMWSSVTNMEGQDGQDKKISYHRGHRGAQRKAKA